MGTPREQLADLLKRVRVEAGYETQGALAAKLKVTRSVVTKAENSTRPVPSDALLAGWSSATDTPLDKLMELAKRCRSGTPEWFMPYRVAEGEASTIRCWGPLLVPGLLQTEGYARATLAVEPYTPDQLSELVAARMARQQAVGRAHVSAVIEHTVLQRCLGSPRIMAEQCARLAELAEHPKTRIYVIPEGANVGLYGAFNLAARDGIVTVNLTSIRDVSSTESGLVDETMRGFEQLLACAMPQKQSLDFIRNQREHWEAIDNELA